MSQAVVSGQRVLSRPVLLYQTVKSSRKFHALNCDCTGRADDTCTAQTTVQGALALNYHPAGCVAAEVRQVLGDSRC
jgi:hypothetical protein